MEKRKHEVYPFRLIIAPFGEVADNQLRAAQAECRNFFSKLV